MRDPVQIRAIKTKGKILQAGRTLIAERGYYNVTADDIADAAGASVGSFYAYFADKHALFLALVDDYLDSGGRVVSEAVDSLSTGPKMDVSALVARGIRLLLAAHRRSPGLMREILQMALADGKIRSRLSGMDAHVTSLISEVLKQRGVDSGRAAAISFAVYHASEGVVHALAFGGSTIDEQAVVDELTRLLTAYVTDIL